MSAINDPIAAASSGPSEPVQEVQVDVTKLTALSPEVISKQATVCRFPHRARSLVDESGNLERMRWKDCELMSHVSTRFIDQHWYHWSCRAR